MTGRARHDGAAKFIRLGDNPSENSLNNGMPSIIQRMAIALFIMLFIHGATGTPRNWRYFIKHIDRTRFQPWFFYYPSGLRIDSMAYLLLWKLANLQAKYHFNKIYFTATEEAAILFEPTMTARLLCPASWTSGHNRRRR